MHHQVTLSSLATHTRTNTKELLEYVLEYVRVSLVLVLSPSTRQHSLVLEEIGVQLQCVHPTRCPSSFEGVVGCQRLVSRNLPRHYHMKSNICLMKFL